MAEVLLQRLLDQAGVEAEVLSAGTMAWPGGGAHPNSIATVARVGLDLSGHRTRPLTEGLARWADVALGMESSHVASVLELDSDAEAHLITDFLIGDTRHGIIDPIGSGPELYEEVFSEIRECLENFVDRVIDRIGGV